MPIQSGLGKCSASCSRRCCRKRIAGCGGPRQTRSNSRKNPLQVPVREITVIIDTGKLLRIVTNDLDARAEEIADLYKQRWQIELFFRWVKQTLRIRHFIGIS